MSNENMTTGGVVESMLTKQPIGSGKMVRQKPYLIAIVVLAQLEGDKGESVDIISLSEEIS